MKRLTAILIFFSVEALLALLWVFLTPSASSHPAVLWLSIQRVALLALAFFLFAVLVTLAIYIGRSHAASTAVSQTLDRWCLEEGRLGSIILPLLVGPILIALGVWQVLATPLQYAAYSSWAPDTFPLLHAVVVSLLPLLCALALISLETAAYLVSRYRAVLAVPASWSWSRVSPALLGLLIV
ncbi:MAG: hypothetical protein ACK2T0_02035, partial [Anaerolineales bacterium]